MEIRVVLSLFRVVVLGEEEREVREQIQVGNRPERALAFVANVSLGRGVESVEAEMVALLASSSAHEV